MKFLPLLLLSFSLFLGACASVKNAKDLEGSGTIDLRKTADSDTYGYSEKNPIKVGGVEDNLGPAMERKFLNQLAGPNGEEISFTRTESCCSFDTPRGFMGAGLLDKYEITYDGQTSPVTLYINMYDYEEPMIPVGFTRRKE